MFQNFQLGFFVIALGGLFAESCSFDLDSYSAVTISTRTTTLSLLGESQRLTATAKGTDGMISWTTSDASIATVVNGVVTPANPGTARIVARSGSRYNTCVVTVIAPQTVSTLAGAPGTGGYQDGQGASALFKAPTALTLLAGNLLVADYSNGHVRSVTPSGFVTTLFYNSNIAVYARNLLGVAADEDGNLFWASNNGSPPSGKGLLRLGSGSVTLWAGNSFGPLHRGPSGHLYSIKATGLVDLGRDPDGTSTSVPIAGLSMPYDFICDAAGSLYVSNSGTQQVLKVGPSGGTSVLAGGFTNPQGLAVAPNGDLYVTDYGANRVYRVTPGGSATVLTGSSSGYADGATSVAQFSGPSGIVLDPVRLRLYVSDQGNNVIRVIQ